MTTASERILEQTQDLIEATVRARRQIKAVDLCISTNLGLCQLRRHLRALMLDGRIHRVRPMGGGAPAGGIWAAGPGPLGLDGEDDPAEPIHISTRTWAAPTVRISALEAHLFGRAAAPEVRA